MLLVRAVEMSMQLVETNVEEDGQALTQDP